MLRHARSPAAFGDGIHEKGARMSQRPAGQVGALVARGLFNEALACLRSHHPGQFPPNHHAILLAEMCESTGDQQAAVGIATSLLEAAGTQPLLRSRCQTILGLVARHGGDLREALQRFQRAAGLAEQESDFELLSWAQLRSMTTLAEDAGADAVAGLRDEIRRNVARSGNPHVVAAFHLFVGEIEAKRGLLDPARRHLRAADAILAGQANAWLEGVAALDACCLCFMRSDFEEALAHADRAIRFAKASGHARSHLAAIANLGALYLNLGDHDRAWKHLYTGLRLSERFREARVVFLDTCAELKLAVGDSDGCEKFLDEVRNAIAGQSLTHPSWHERWSLQTRIRLLHGRGEWQRAIELSAEGIRLATSSGDRLMSLQFRLLEADALIETGRRAEAADLMSEAACDYEVPPLTIAAEVERLQGKLLARSGRVDLASRRFDRALALHSLAGNACARIDTLRDYAAALHERPPAPFGVAGSTPPPPARSRKRRHVASCGDAVSSLAGRVAGGRSSLLDAAASLIDLAPYPELLGREALWLLAAANCTESAVLACCGPGRKIEAIGWHGCNYEAAVSIAAGSPPAWNLLPVGTTADRDYRVVARPRLNPVATGAFLAVRKIVAAAATLEDLRRERRDSTALWPLEDEAGESGSVFAAKSMTDLLGAARKIAALNLTVLVTGETGSGKEVLARTIHEHSPRRSRTFLPFNCTAVPRDMIDSQLFGYRRGAFTGALDQFPGVIRAAEGGTLFLDEIGELGLDIQPKLLRFLESEYIHPLGETAPVKVDVRVIAATNADLDALVAVGRFREDLFYRLNVIRLRVPPLRDRREEIPVLAHHFLRRYEAEFRKGPLRIAEETMERLLLFRWPGNVRQLGNEIRQLVAFAEPGGVLLPSHLSDFVRGVDGVECAAAKADPAAGALPQVVVRLDQPLGDAVDTLEKAMLDYAMRQSAGHVGPAAGLLGLSRKGLYLKRQRLKL
jgi:DNA-binding NtrC family response regulator/tetratricopeptide (TPR) repeat protein